MCHTKTVADTKGKSSDQTPKVGRVSNVEHIESSSEDDSDDDEVYVFRVSTPQFANDLYPVQLGNQNVNLLIDSGCNLNILDEKVFHTLKPQPALTPLHTRIYPYQADKQLEVLVMFKTMLTVSDKSTRVKFHVVKGKGGALLGRPAAEKLDVLRVGPPVNEHATVASMSDTTPPISEIRKKHVQVFTGVGELKNFELKLHINPDVTPVQQAIRRIPYHTRKKVSAELQRLQQLDIIEPVKGPTSWVNPIVVVLKPNGKIRMCLDMRIANEAIIQERQVIPKIDDVLTELHGAKYFSKIDLCEGYYQIQLHEDSRDITTFATNEGLFRYKRLIYGVSSAFESFQKQIEIVISGCPGSKNISDDILIWGSSEQEHNRHPVTVLARFDEAGLKVNWEKCIFGANHIAFAGHELSAEGIAPQKSRVEAIQNMKAPSNATEVRSFLGMVNFCNKYIKDYSAITAPLRLLTKKRKRFFWRSAQQGAFETLKEWLTSAEVMAFYNPDADTELIVDGSPIGLGAILAQKQPDGNFRPVAYGSNALSPIQQHYSQTEWEALAVLWPCQHFHHYVYDNHVTIITDHKPLLQIFSSKSQQTTKDSTMDASPAII